MDQLLLCCAASKSWDSGRKRNVLQIDRSIDPSAFFKMAPLWLLFKSELYATGESGSPTISPKRFKSSQLLLRIILYNMKVSVWVSVFFRDPEPTCQQNRLNWIMSTILKEAFPLFFVKGKNASSKIMPATPHA